MLDHTTDIDALRAAHPDHWMRAAAIRTLTLDAVAAAKSGHSGMPMGMADVATVLWGKHLRYHAADPHWPDRDRFVLSAGHGSMLLYSLLHLTGGPGMSLQDLRDFRQLESSTAGHPEYGDAPGVETTTGPLGQGLATAVGMAVAEAHLRARWGAKIVDHRTWVIAGDGCLMEGVSQEAIALAGHLRLSQPDRALRRQRHHHRRQGVAGRQHRPEGALGGVGLGRAGGRRPRPRRHRRRAGGGEGEGPSRAGGLPDAYRHRLAAAGHRQGPRRASPIRTPWRRRPARLWLGPPALRDPPRS